MKIFVKKLLNSDKHQFLKVTIYWYLIKILKCILPHYNNELSHKNRQKQHNAVTKSVLMMKLSYFLAYYTPALANSIFSFPLICINHFGIYSFCNSLVIDKLMILHVVYIQKLWDRKRANNTNNIIEKKF